MPLWQEILIYLAGYAVFLGMVAAFIKWVYRR